MAVERISIIKGPELWVGFSFLFASVTDEPNWAYRNWTQQGHRCKQKSLWKPSYSQSCWFWYTDKYKGKNETNLTFSFSILSGSLKPLAAIKTQLDLNLIFMISLLPSSSTNFLASFFNLGKHSEKMSVKNSGCEKWLKRSWLIHALYSALSLKSKSEI